jgi:hypothetical protein
MGYVCGILEELGHTLSKASLAAAKDKSDLKAFKDWIEAAAAFKPHYFKPLKHLLPNAEALQLETTETVRKSKNKLRDEINGHLLENPNIPIAIEEDRVNPNTLTSRQKCWRL